MGMYDYIICKYPLPDGLTEAIQFQTKDTPSQYCEPYKITVDGELWVEEGEYELKAPKEKGDFLNWRGAIKRDYQDLYKQPTHPVLGLSRTICRIGSPTSAIWCYWLTTVHVPPIRLTE